MMTMKYGLALNVMALCIMMTKTTVGGALIVAQRIKNLNLQVIGISKF